MLILSPFHEKEEEEAKFPIDRLDISDLEQEGGKEDEPEIKASDIVNDLIRINIKGSHHITYDNKNRKKFATFEIVDSPTNRVAIKNVD